ncbi:hypothetical protein FS749_003356 [Ceratobasidium sp. UAMH 11750]|nr:hypothetical protein FS749_003356 [Ceratobasidium sp. UAMH 11750]
MQDIDSDLENPIEVDDESWPIGGVPAQPAAKPSKVAYFSGLIGLSRVLGRAQQTVFAIGRTKRQMDLIGHDKEKMLLKDLQFHMGRWQLTVPPHLRLPRLEEFVPSTFLDQAVSLWALYYNTVILIHRPFITIKSSPLTAECLDICRSSARACAKIMQGHMRVSEGVTLPQTLQPAFSSAMVLLVDILATKNAEKQGLRVGGGATEEWYPMWEKEQDVEHCMRVLACAERRWHVAGRLHDVLRELQRSGQLLTPEPVIPQPAAAGPGLARPLASSWVPPSQPPIGQSALAGTSITNYPVTFTSNFASLEYSSLGTTRIVTAGSGVTHHMSSRSSAHGAWTSNYGHTHQFNAPEVGHPMTYPHNSPAYNQTNAGRVGSILAQPNLVDAYQYDTGAYLPDAFYGGDLNVPFPGIVPQLNFVPNHERGDLSGTVFEDSYYEGANNSGWTTDMQEPTSVSQWEMMMNNALNLAGAPQPR